MDSQGDLGQEESPQELAKRLGIKVNDDFLLARALTHRSYLNEHPEALEDNERLEFLGDAVLDFLVAAWLYNRFPEMKEGELTRLRSALVSTEQLAEFARQIDLSAAMRLGRGETENGGRQRLTMLCDMFEALVGALYLDAGMDGVREFIFPFLETAVGKVLQSDGGQDPKSQLQEWAQSKSYGAPSYRVVSIMGPDHDRTFEVEAVIQGKVYGRGRGHSKQAASKAAARQALNALGLE